MDDIDRQLVRVLVADGRLTYQELARIVALSANSTADRVRRLRQNATISGYHAEFNLASVGCTLHALTDIKLKEHVSREDFEKALEAVPQVLGAIHTTGEFDYQLRIACTGTADLQRLVDTVRRLGAREVQSRIVLGERSFDPTRLLG